MGFFEGIIEAGKRVYEQHEKKMNDAYDLAHRLSDSELKRRYKTTSDPILKGAFQNELGKRGYKASDI